MVDKRCDATHVLTWQLTFMLTFFLSALLSDGVVDGLVASIRKLLQQREPARLPDATFEMGGVLGK